MGDDKTLDALHYPANRADPLDLNAIEKYAQSVSKKARRRVRGERGGQLPNNGGTLVLASNALALVARVRELTDSHYKVAQALLAAEAQVRDLEAVCDKWQMDYDALVARVRDLEAALLAMIEDSGEFVPAGTLYQAERTLRRDEETPRG